MKKLFADLVQETTATAGTGTVALAQSAGWARFSDRFANNDRVYYSIRDGNNWEVGYGTYVATNQLARTTILGTLNAGTWTNGGTALTLASGGATVRAVAPEAFLTALWKVDPITVAGNVAAAAGQCMLVTANACTITLPASPAVGDRVELVQGAAAITGTVVDPGAEKINGNATTMLVDTADFSFTLVYTGATYGWKVDR